MFPDDPDSVNSPSPTDGHATKARYIRWLYRRSSNDDASGRARRAFERLFPDREARLYAQIVAEAWIEARKLAGWTYDYNGQHWCRADGTVVVYDDGSEWRHL